MGPILLQQLNIAADAQLRFGPLQPGIPAVLPVIQPLVDERAVLGAPIIRPFDPITEAGQSVAHKVYVISLAAEIFPVYAAERLGRGPVSGAQRHG